MRMHLLHNGDAYEVEYESETGFIQHVWVYPENTQRRGQLLALTELTPHLLHKINEQIRITTGENGGCFGSTEDRTT